MLPNNFKEIKSVECLKNAAKNAAGEIADFYEITYRTTRGNQGRAQGLKESAEIVALLEWNAAQRPANQKQIRVH